jgi:hypothetical protein
MRVSVREDGAVAAAYIFFIKTCIARFSLRGGEQSGNKAREAQSIRTKRQQNTKQN